jgi:hypothetical protein
MSRRNGFFITVACPQQVWCLLPNSMLRCRAS